MSHHVLTVSQRPGNAHDIKNETSKLDLIFLPQISTFIFASVLPSFSFVVYQTLATRTPFHALNDSSIRLCLGPAHHELGQRIPYRLKNKEKCLATLLPSRIPETHLCGHRHSCRSHDHRQDHGGDPHLSSPDLCRQGFGSDPGLVCHNHAHGDHPCEESSRLGHDEVGKRSDVVESDRADLVDPVGHGHGLNRSARMRKGEYEPTRYMVS